MDWGQMLHCPSVAEVAFIGETFFAQGEVERLGQQHVFQETSTRAGHGANFFP